ncbi:hypothetical protein Nmel_013940 [Mimus melanotis]
MRVMPLPGRHLPGTTAPAGFSLPGNTTAEAAQFLLMRISDLQILLLLKDGARTPFSQFGDILSPLSQVYCGNYMQSGKTLTVACPRNYDPVCGTNGRTYPNECSLCRDFFRNRALDKKHDGRCVRVDCTGFLKPGIGYKVPCTSEYNPICGTNGITYRNKCQFCTAVASGLEVNLQSYGQCNQQQISNIDCTQQKGSNLFCTSEYNPICGSDGRTYGNKCQFCNAVS